MSQVIQVAPEKQAVADSPAEVVFQFSDDERQPNFEPEVAEFDYKPTPIIAPVSLVLGLISATALLGLFGILIAAISTIVGLIAWWMIARSDGTYSGGLIAKTGFAASILFFLSGTSFAVYNYQTEVPEGFERVSFSQDISAKGFLVKDGVGALHPDVEKLIDQKIFLKGYMYPQRTTVGLQQFLLLKDTGECCFGGQPKQTDMILVRMQDGQTVDYRQGRVSVAGHLRLLTQHRTSEGLEPVYALDGVHFSRSMSAF